MTVLRRAGPSGGRSEGAGGHAPRAWDVKPDTGGRTPIKGAPSHRSVGGAGGNILAERWSPLTGVSLQGFGAPGSDVPQRSSQPRAGSSPQGIHSTQAEPSACSQRTTGPERKTPPSPKQIRQSHAANVWRSVEAIGLMIAGGAGVFLQAPFGQTRPGMANGRRGRRISALGGGLLAPGRWPDSRRRPRPQCPTVPFSCARCDTPAATGRPPNDAGNRWRRGDGSKRRPQWDRGARGAVAGAAVEWARTFRSAGRAWRGGGGARAFRVIAAVGGGVLSYFDSSLLRPHDNLANCGAGRGSWAGGDSWRTCGVSGSHNCRGSWPRTI